MSTHIDAQVAHHLLENVALADRTLIQVNHFRNALKREAIDLLWRHRVEQETQGGFHILAIDTSVLLVSHAAAVIDHAEEHQRRRAFVCV
jgi:hypothetical protein